MVDNMQMVQKVTHVTGRTCDGCNGRGKTMDYCEPDSDEEVDCCECDGTGGWALTQRELDEYREAESE